jgi:hypothetical protein
MQVSDNDGINIGYKILSMDVGKLTKGLFWSSLGAGGKPTPGPKGGRVLFSANIGSIKNFFPAY